MSRSDPLGDSEIRKETKGDESDAAAAPSVTDCAMPEVAEAGGGSAPPRSRRLIELLKKLDYIPPACRWDPEQPPKFNWAMCFLFASAAAFTVSNLYYNHPILNILAKDFGVTDEEASHVPTVMQAGYAAGLLFICPIGDIMRRRPLTLLLIFFTANVWLGLCITHSFRVFLGLSFVCALTTVTPQLMLPLVAELAPPRRRAMMISVVFGGLFMGVLLARILSGVVSQFVSWRVIYFIAFGIQYVLLILLFLFLPDYPSINTDLSYLSILWSIIRIPMRQPLLVQASIVSFLISAVFVSFWTTLTFLLASSPFDLSTLAIGLFALIGIPPFILNPFASHHIVDKHHPTLGTLTGLTIQMAGVCIGTWVGTFSLAGPVLMGIMVDLGMIVAQTALRTQLVHIEPLARNRVNTCFMVSSFCGMLMGTAVGNSLYARGGWHYSGYADVGFVGAAALMVLARGPHETGWLGWRGGWSLKKVVPVEEKSEAAQGAPPDVEAGETSAAEGLVSPGEKATEGESSPPAQGSGR
ncbi:Major facilitator superfamily transporter [Pleurostoma richardsiae]|uniref:Major facilitator superfamily transporter n=1 Tax=Pleurostoma richardsiae TaxID=41990 RepID=A0AA38VPS6_9PEZI|nr:Major facilitator superfamily transporter [Pleurostoma richardsiae]